MAQGFIETLGLVSAMEAADAMSKAAHVKLEEVRGAGCGLITLVVTGDVGAVQSAVEAGRAAVERLPGGKLWASNVIARPAYDQSVFSPKKNCCIPEKNTLKSSLCSSKC